MFIVDSSHVPWFHINPAELTSLWSCFSSCHLPCFLSSHLNSPLTSYFQPAPSSCPVPPPHVYLFPCDPSCQDADPRGPSSKTCLSFSPFTSSLFIFTRHPAVPPLLSSLLLLCVGTSLECLQPSKTPSNQKYTRCCCYCLKSWRCRKKPEKIHIKADR